MRPKHCPVGDATWSKASTRQMASPSPRLRFLSHETGTGVTGTCLALKKVGGQAAGRTYAAEIPVPVPVLEILSCEDLGLGLHGSDGSGDMKSGLYFPTSQTNVSTVPKDMSVQL